MTVDFFRRLHEACPTCFFGEANPDDTFRAFHRAAHRLGAAVMVEVCEVHDRLGVPVNASKWERWETIATPEEPG